MKLTRILSAACGVVGLSAFLLYAAGPAPSPALPEAPARSNAVLLADESADAAVETARTEALARIDLMSQCGLYSGLSCYMAKRKVNNASSQAEIDAALIDLAKTAYGKSFYITSGRTTTSYNNYSLMLGTGDNEGKVIVEVTGTPDAWIINAPSENIAIDDIDKVIIQSKSVPTTFWGTWDTQGAAQGNLETATSGSIVNLSYLTDNEADRFSPINLQPSGMSEGKGLCLWSNSAITGAWSAGDKNCYWFFTPADEIKTSTDSETHWYTVKSCNSDRYISSNGTDDAQAQVNVIGSTSNPVQLWKVEAGEGDAIRLKGRATEGAGDALYLKMKQSDGAYNTTTPTDLFILQKDFNKFGVVISSENSYTGNTCFCAQTTNPNILYWKPTEGDWKQTSWIFEEADPEYLDLLESKIVTYINKTTDGYYLGQSETTVKGAHNIALADFEHYTTPATVDIYDATGAKTTGTVGSSINPSGNITIVASYATDAHVEAVQPPSLVNEFVPYVNSFIWDAQTNRNGFRYAETTESKLIGKTNYPEEIEKALWVFEPTGISYKIKNVKHGTYVKFESLNASATEDNATVFDLIVRSDSYFDIKCHESNTYWNGDAGDDHPLASWSDGHPHIIFPGYASLYYEVTEKWLMADGSSVEGVSDIVNKVAPGESFTSTDFTVPGLAVKSTAYSDGATVADLAAVGKDITITYTVGEDSSVKPITLFSNERGANNRYLSVSADGSKLGAVAEADASAIWLPYPSETDETKYNLYNPYINKYLQGIQDYTVSLTPDIASAALLTITTDANGNWHLNAGTETGTHTSLHLDPQGAPCGWTNDAGASAWTVAYPDAATINGFTTALVSGLPDIKITNEIATSLTNTGVWSETEMNNASAAYSKLADVSGLNASTLPTYAEEAALKITDISSVIVPYLQALDNIVGRKVTVVNNRHANSENGCTATSLLNQVQYKYGGFMGVNGANTLNFAGPVQNAQATFEIVGDKLYLKFASAYVKSADDSDAVSMVTDITQATPISIQKNGDFSVIVFSNGRGALNIPSWGTNYVTYNSLTDDGSQFIITPYEEYIPTLGEGYYFVMAYNRWFLSSDATFGGFLSAPFTDETIPAEGTRVEHTTVSPLAIWKFTQGSTDGAVHIESLADGYYLGRNADNLGVLSQTPADWFITANGANNGAGYAIRIAANGNALDASGGNSSVGNYGLYTNDWLGTTWVFAPVNDEYVAACHALLFNLDDCKANAISRLDNLKLITQLYAADDIEAAKAQISDATTEEQINSIVDAAVKTAAGKTIYIYVTKAGTEDNYYITDMGAGNDVNGVKDGGENDGWKFEAVADGLVLKNIASGRYLTMPSHFQTSANVDEACILEVSTPADGSYIWITVPAATGNKNMCFNGNNGYIELYNASDPHAHWHLETVRLDANQASAVAQLEAMKSIPALYDAADIEAAIAQIGALDASSANLDEKIAEIVAEQKQKADGKIVTLWVQFTAVTPNAPRWMTDVDGNVKGLPTTSAEAFWTVKYDAESGLYRLLNQSGKYMSQTHAFTTEVSPAKAGLFDFVPLATDQVTICQPAVESSSKYLNINRNEYITLYLQGDPHSIWNIANIDQEVAQLKADITAAKNFIEDLPNEALLSGSSSIKAEKEKALDAINCDNLEGSKLIDAVVAGRAAVEEAENIVETILDSRAEENRGLPFQIFRTGRGENAPLKYLAIQSNKVVVLEDATEPATLWIANFVKSASAKAAALAAEDDTEAEGDTHFTLFNPATGLYIQSTPTSTSLALTQVAEDAALFTLNPGDGGVAFYHGDTPSPTSSAIHLDGYSNVVGWTGTADFSMWQMKDVTADEVNTMAEATFGTTEGGETEGMEGIIASLKVTGLWDDATVEALDDVAANGFTPSEDVKAAAASFGTAGTVARESVIPIVAKRFGISNTRLATEGLTTPDAATQHQYASFVGLNNGEAFITSAPTINAQWSFNIIGTNLYLQNHYRQTENNTKKDIIQLVKETNGTFSLVSDPEEATPITIAEDGDIVFPDGKVLTLNDDLTLTTAEDTSDEGTAFTYHGLLDHFLSHPDSYFVMMSYNRGGFLTSDAPVDGEAISHIGFNDQALWKMEKANDEGGYYISNFVEGLYLGISGSQPVVTTSKTILYVTKNAADNGRGFSIRGSATGNRLDAHNNDTAVGTYGGSSTDWEGTTWVISPVPDALVAAMTEANANEGLYGTIVEKLPARIKQLYAVPTLFDESAVTNTLAAYEKIAADENLSPKEKATAMEAQTQELFRYAQEVPFLLINKRRYDNAMTANAYGDKGYVLRHYQTLTNDGYLDKYEFRTSVLTDKQALWRLEYIGQGIFNLKAGNQAWIGAIPSAYNTPFNAAYAEDAYHGRFIFVDNTTEGGEKTFAIAQYGHSLEPDATDAYLSININEDGETGVVRYSAGDSGSKWIAMLPNETLDRQSDIDGGIFVISSSVRLSKHLGVNPGVMIDPLSSPVTGANSGPGAFWELTKTGEQTWSMRNLFTDRYLAQDLSWSEEPVDWYILPNGANSDNLYGSNIGVVISTDAQKSKCIDMGGAGNISLWRPSENDYEGTSWIFTRSDTPIASKMAIANYKDDKAGFEKDWITDYLGEISERVPSWAREPFYSAKSDYDDVKTSMAKNDFTKVNYVDLLSFRNSLWSKLQSDMTRAFVENGAGHAVQLTNDRRSDRFNEFNTEHLLGASGSSATFVNSIDNNQDESTLWFIEPADDGTAFHLVAADGKYLGGADAPASLTTDKTKAGKFNVRYVLYSTYDGVTYQPNYGLALAYAGAETGLHGALTQNTPINYYVTDPGSFWRIESADLLGIGNVSIGNAPALDLSDCDLFTLDGRRINRADAAPGIYVARRADGKSVKVVIR